MKRVLSFVLTVAMLVSLIPAAAAASFQKTNTWSDGLFADVAAEDWYYETVKTAYELDLMKGTGDGKFNPTGEITLAETITIAARIHAIHTTGKDEFEQGSPWYQVYVDYALENGILSEPLSTYTRTGNRMEFAEILAKALPTEALPAVNTVEDRAIPDVAVSDDIYMLYRAGILTGTDANGTFKADGTISRSEVATIAARMADPELRVSITLRNEDSMDEPEEEEEVSEPSGPAYEYPDYDEPDYEYPDYDYPEYDEPDYDDTTDEEDTSDSVEDEADDVIDENNALTVPFDQAYPDLFASGEVNYSGEQILIKLAGEPTGEQQAALNAAGVTGLEEIMNLGQAKWYKAYVSGDVNSVMQEVRALSFVVIAEYDFVYETDTIIECTPEDLDEGIKDNDYFDKQWYLRTGGIKDSWDHLKNPHKRPNYDEENGEAGVEEGAEETAGVEAGEGIVVAVIDTGVDYTHEDLNANIWVNVGEVPNNGVDDDGNGYVDDYYGYDAVADRGSAMDDNGHGTHVAGIVAASNNDLGIVGIAYNATIMPIKAGMASGYFNQSDIAEAILYAYEMGADVINMSFGGSASTILVQDALETAYTRCVLVAAAGNDGYPNEATDCYYPPRPSYPAALSYVLGVMSVGQGGVESYFTNWDAYGFNSVEYEVYAPGEEMISTIPGDRYATWSGTSMATPVVSAIAALVRSEYRDNNTYPTKFIYGQICGTGEQSAICCNPQAHTVNGRPHNLPKIVDVYNALTVMPNPDVSVTDYTIFDTPGIAGNYKNNGDGVVDAGETIAVGFALRNKWGKSTNTTISADTLSQAGIPDPYITIHNPSVTIGEVGTYSVNDCGKVMNGDVWVGWENPIYVTVSENCPNDYIFTLNITVTCKNGLDADDATVYSSGAKVNEFVRNGVILPNLIDEDMVLTKDNYYVIPNATLIKEGVTVIVQPGTQIQFWSDDPGDTYADAAITYLNVEGTLICNGTAEEPIKIFPSELMGLYRVEIVEKNKGTVKMFHTEVVNPYVDITYAEGCRFSQNYRAEGIWFRYLSSGQVYVTSNSAYVYVGMAKECAFYKLGSYYTYGNCYSGGNHDSCIFVDSAMNFCGQYENCLFYGNNNYLGESNGSASSLLVNNNIEPENISAIQVDSSTGTTYMVVQQYIDPGEGKKTVENLAAFAQFLGGHLAYIETQEELTFINEALGGTSSDLYVIGIHKDSKTDQITWMDGTPVGEHIDCTVVGNETCGALDLWSSDNKVYVGSFDWNDLGGHTVYYTIIEVPGIHVEEITLSRYAVTLDTAGAPYQISASAFPSDVADVLLVYKSMDETVATVSSDGLVTPVGVGTTEIRVYSPDLYLYNTLNVTVADEVLLEAVSLGEDFRMGVGESVQLNPVFVPADSSKQYLVYESSNPAVVSVNVGGVVTAHGVGFAVVTATNPETGITASITVEGIITATGISAEEPLYATKFTTVETVDVLNVTVTPENATYQDLIWTSSNPEILSVEADGTLVKNAAGTATLRATVAGTDLHVDVVVCLTDMDTAVTVVQLERLSRNGYEYTMALLSDGSLWCWGNEMKVPQKLTMFEDVRVKQFGVDTYQLVIVDSNDTLNVYGGYQSDSPIVWHLDNYSVYDNPVTNVAKLTSCGDSYYYLKSDGSVWCWGSNHYGQLGIGNIGYESRAVQMSIDEPIVDIAAGSNYVILLDEDGNAYYAGNTNGYSSTIPCFYKDGVISIRKDGNQGVTIEYATQQEYLLGCLIEKKGQKTYYSYLYGDLFYLDAEGSVYSNTSNRYGQAGVGTASNNVYDARMLKVENAVELFLMGGTVYVQTEDGKLYGVGRNDTVQIPNLSAGNQSIPTRIYFGLEEETATPVLEQSNLQSGVLNESVLVLDYDQALMTGSAYASIRMTDSAGTLVGIRRTFALDKVELESMNGFTAGETYTLIIPASAFTNKFGVATETLTLTFTAGEGAVDSNGGSSVDDSADSDLVEEVVNVTQVDPEADARVTWSKDLILACWEEYAANGINPLFYHNAIINRLNNDDVSRWLRPQGISSESHTVRALTGNYWGTTSEFLIGKQILDFDDYQSLLDLNEGNYLTTAPANVWPFVVDAWVETAAGRVDVIGNELVTFCVQFNRPMNTAIELDVRFGSTYPYADYQLDGAWVSSTLWKGTTTLTTLIEAGYQYWSVSNGCAADNAALTLYKDWGRFPFEIDTSEALAMTLQGYATETGIQLTWTQDDFETLMGYNVYRADQDEDAYYQRLNSSIVPVGTEEFFDSTVEPGKDYYYIFTVVKTDLTESEPSGKIKIQSLDTMSPSIYHTPVYEAYVGNNIVISATVTDNLAVQGATLYYSIAGGAWQSVEMQKLNDKYSALISGNNVTQDGICYYITATDGVSVTTFGTQAKPYTITVKEAPTSLMPGDVNGDGVIGIADALLVLRAKNNKVILNSEQFDRADWNGDGVLSAAEALAILRYANGEISSLQ